jgi:hypothetical protein
VRSGCNFANSYIAGAPDYRLSVVAGPGGRWFLAVMYAVLRGTLCAYVNYMFSNQVANAYLQWFLTDMSSNRDLNCHVTIKVLFEKYGA